MFTNRFSRPSASERRLRRRAALRRRSTIQRLEPRCVMAADLISEVAPDQIVSTYDDVEEVGIVQPVSQRVAPELNLLVDLFNNQTITFKTAERQPVVVTFDPAQLESFYGASETVLVQVVYDPAQWNAPVLEAPGSENDARLRTVSLTDQASEISIEVQFADPTEDGSQTTIVIKFASVGSVSDTNAMQSTMEPLQRINAHQRTESNATTIGSDFELASDVPRFSPIDSSLADKHFEPGGNAEDDFSDGPDMTWAGDGASDTQPLDQSESNPLPESRRESVDRLQRPARRTIDIRSQGASNWSATTVNRAPVSPESLATQSALAGVYDTDNQSASEPTRPMLDPKPARLQVATFLLSRARRDGSAVVINVTKPAAKIEEPAKANLLSRVEPRRLARPAIEADSQSSVTQVAPAQTEAEVTLTVTKDEVSEEESLPASEATYASVVDRLLGSPLSLVAILGLTVVARLSESDEIIG